MPNTYSELYYHFVWSTQDRMPLVTAELEPAIFRYIRHKCRELGVMVYALNGTEDHLHLAASVPARLALADFIHDVKGSSSRLVNEQLGGHSFRWQEGYGVFTLAKRDLKNRGGLHRWPEGTPRVGQGVPGMGTLVPCGSSAQQGFPIVARRFLSISWRGWRSGLKAGAV